jgi:hypothetical protein
MGARRTWRHRALATKGAAVVLAVALVAGCGDTSTRSNGSAEEEVPLAEVSGEVTGEITVAERSGVTAPAVAVEGVEVMTPVLEVATDGAVTGEVEIRVPISQVPSGDHVVFALTAERAEGPWELLPARIDGDVVVITTTHLSLFQAFMSLVGAVEKVAREAIDGLTSGAFAEAGPPSCEDEAGARDDGHEISSDDGDTVYWCFGRDTEGRFLRVVNNRRYALLLSHSADISVLEQAPASLDIVGALSRNLTLDHQVSVAPRDEVTFRVAVEPGGSAVVATELDGVGSALAQLQMGVETLVTILTRFGTRHDASARLLSLLEMPECAEAVARGNAGSIVADCFDLDTLREVFGWGAAVLLGPVVIAGSLVSYFQSQLNAFGDQRNGRDAYRISIDREDVAPLPPPQPVLRDQGLGPLVVGMSVTDAQATGWLGEERPGCLAALGIDPAGSERAFALGGPAAPTGLRGGVVFMDHTLSEISVLSGASVAGAFDLPSGLTLAEAGAALEGAGYTVEITTVFEPDDYLMATEADGDTLSVMGPIVGQAGIPQLTTCD